MAATATSDKVKAAQSSEPILGYLVLSPIPREVRFETHSLLTLGKIDGPYQTLTGRQLALSPRVEKQRTTAVDIGKTLETPYFPALWPGQPRCPSDNRRQCHRTSRHPRSYTLR
jgi:hypothetical protein